MPNFTNVIAGEETYFVVYPRVALSGELSGVLELLRPNDQRRDRGEPSLIAGIEDIYPARADRHL
ncbi:MAG: hypothetical protein ABSE67_15970 [Xanthobacteraceae bacterium]